MIQHNILEYGAMGDNKTVNTTFIQAAIDNCSPGDEVIIPRGVFISGSLFLHGNIKLVIEDGAVLRGVVILMIFHHIYIVSRGLINYAMGVCLIQSMETKKILKFVVEV